MRLIFAGTPAFAVPSLKALIEQNYTICGVYTQPDRPAQRGQRLQASAVKQFAVEQGLPVYQPATLRDPKAQRELATLNADAMIVVAYGLLLPEAVLTAPKHGCINVHGSLLPKWRGAAPIQRALAAGDTVTGVTIMAMDKGLDTGGMYLQKSLVITTTDTSASLFDKLSALGAAALLEALPAICDGTLLPTAQENALSSHAAKLTKAEAEVNWQQPAAVIECHIRAFNPWPMAWMDINGQVIKIHHAEVAVNPEPSCTPGTWLRLAADGLWIACATGALRITHLQLPNQRCQAVAAIYKTSLQELAKHTL